MKTFNQNVSKITAATLVALTLAACGGGGSNHTPQTNSTPTLQPSNSNQNTQPNGNSQNSATSSAANQANSQAKFLAEAKANKTYGVSSLRGEVHKELSSEYHTYGYRNLDSYNVRFNGKSYSSGNIDLSTLGNGIQRIPFTETATATVGGEKGTAVRNNTLHLYQQPYSILAGVEVKGGNVTAPGLYEPLDGEGVDFATVKGYATQTLPTSGKFNYAGEALSQDQTGKFNYTVDFAAKTGRGSISNIAGGITLNEGQIGAMSHTNPDNTSISGYGISSTARSNSGLSGSYKLGFFGPNADEVAGVVTSEQGDVGFGGKKQ